MERWTDHSYSNRFGCRILHSNCKDDNNCSTSAGPVTITEPTAVSASMGVPTMVSCNGFRWKVLGTGSGGTVAGDYTYLWSDGQTTATATGLLQDSYTVTVKDDNNCST